MPAFKQHNSSNGSKASIRQWCSSPTSNQPISMQPKLSRPDIFLPSSGRLGQILVLWGSCILAQGMRLAIACLRQVRLPGLELLTLVVHTGALHAVRAKLLLH
eukprot:1140005-Pelagomonas_calceolata.AAC.3